MMRLSSDSFCLIAPHISLLKPEQACQFLHSLIVKIQYNVSVDEDQGPCLNSLSSVNTLTILKYYISVRSSTYT